MLTQICAASANLGLTSLDAFYGGAVTLDFDRSVVLVMVLFMGLAVVLKPLLFDPIVKVFEQRELRTEGVRGDAREMQEKAGELLQRYEAELERVNRVAAEERDRIRAETAKLEAEILDEARAVTTKVVEDGRRKIETEVNRIRFDLGKQSERMSKDIAERALGREVN